MALTEMEQQRLHELCVSNGFKKRGKAYFRVHGDGVLQIIKFQYEPKFTHYSLDIGLQSKYSEHLKRWYTSSGCIPRYCITLLKGQSTAVVLKWVLGFLTYSINSPNEQMDLLEEKGFRFLGSIETQGQLVDAIHYLDRQHGRSIWWNDDFKLEPYLASGQYELAEKVICTMLQQHSGTGPDPDIVWSEEDYCEYRKRCLEEDHQWLQIHDWIANSDTESIQNYLQKNYQQNMQYAKFCLK